MLFFPSWIGVSCTAKKADIVEGSLNSKLPTIWTVEKQMRQEVQSEGRRCTSAKVRRKKIHPRQMLEKSQNCCVFSMIRVSGQSKSRPVKAAGAESMWSADKSKIARRCGEKHIWT